VEGPNGSDVPRLTALERPEIARRRRRRRITWTLVLVAVVSLGYLQYKGKKAAASAKAKMQWEERTVALGDVEVVVDETGVVEPDTQVIVKSQVAAEVRDILVHEGDPVAEGEVVAVLDPTRVQQDVDTRAAQVDSALATVRKSEIMLTQTSGTSGAGITKSRAAIDAARAALAISREGKRPEEIAQAEQRAAQAAADLAGARAQLAQLQAGSRPQEVAEQEQLVRQAEHQVAQAKAGQAKAEAGNRIQEVASARAELDQSRAAEAAARAALVKVRAGSRPQEIAQAEAQVSDAQARLTEAEAVLSRQGQLQDAGYASAQAVDTARSTYLSARATLESREQSLALAREGSRPEDVQAAEAELERAVAGTRAAEQRLSLSEAGSRPEDVDQQRQAASAAEAGLKAQQARLELAKAGTRSEQIAQQEAVVARSEAALREAEASLRLARIGSRPQEIEQAAATLKEAEAGLDQALAQGMDGKLRAQDIIDARAQLRSAHTQLMRAQEDLTDCTVRSPVTGVVLKRHIEAGELAASGTTGLAQGTPIITVGNLRQLTVRLQVHEVDVVNLRTDLEAKIRFDAMPGEVFGGKVLEIAPQSTTASQEQAQGRAGATQAGVATFEVKVLISGEDERIRPGMSARVQVVCDSVKAVPTVTLAGLRTRGDATFLLVPSAEGKPEPDERPVTLGLRGASVVEVKDGAAEGDRYLIKKPKTEFVLEPGH
jgi:HlyD family secretion protein